MKTKKKRRIHVCTPATASEMQRTLGITKRHQANIKRAFKQAGVKCP